MVTLPFYANNHSGSPPVDLTSCLRGLCNIPIILLTVCECSPERLPCLIEYPRLHNHSFDFVLGYSAIWIRDHTTSGYHLVYHLG